MTQMDKVYNPNEIETKNYNKWLENGNFKASSDSKKVPYSIVIPPPNVTGILHIGHVLNNTLQDVYIRWHKMKGFETCWVPGTDHASIATESKVVNLLKKEQGISKEELGRENFLKEAMKWKDKHGGLIIKQLKTLGCACDWDRERFTMDKKYSELVIDTFIDLYEKGYIYKGYRLVNWCPASKSVISDEEVLFEEKNGKLWYFNYPIKDSDEFVTIATTRPETMFGDTGIAIHPENEKLKHLIGKTAILPFMNKEIPIIADEHADPEKGSGAVKITPAHDPNDNEVGMRHNLAVINIMNPDATLNNNVPDEFKGLDRNVARKKVVEELQKMGLVVKIVDHLHQVSISERGKVPIEYLMSEQWYLSMKDIVKPAIDVVKEGKIKFHPKRMEKTYFNWLENIKDWCISRQLWWGHQIPVYYCKNKGCEDVKMVSKEKPAKCTKCGSVEHIVQDNDVLDTWASSWLWPYGVHDNKKDENFFYPTASLFTAPDIIFFWVARMVMAGLFFKKEIPFKDVYFHGVVKDEKGRKMSKSLGNSPDPLDIIEEYGADALRFTMIRLTPTGNNILFSKKKCEIGRNFANKIWNAARFLNMHKNNTNKTIKAKMHTEANEDKWIHSKLNSTLKNAQKQIDGFAPNEASKTIYEFLWNDFCDWYIEMIKSRLNSDDEAIKIKALENATYVFETAIKILHPFMPFVTEEIWMNMEERNEKDSIMLQTIPNFDENSIDSEIENNIELVKEIIGRVRNARGQYNIPQNKILNLIVKKDSNILKANSDLIQYLAKIDKIEFDENAAQPELSAGFVVQGIEIFIPLKDFLDLDKEIEKITSEIEKLNRINFGINKKLSNERFVQNAPKEIVAKEQEKMDNNLETIKKLEQSLKMFQK